MRHAIREVIAVFAKLTPVVAGNAHGAVPVVAATAAEDLAFTVFSQVWGQGSRDRLMAGLSLR